MKTQTKTSLIVAFCALAILVTFLLSRGSSLIVGNIGMSIENQAIRAWTFEHLRKAESSRTTDRILEGVKLLATSTDDPHLYTSCLNYLSAFEDRSKFDQWAKNVLNEGDFQGQKRIILQNYLSLNP